MEKELFILSAVYLLFSVPLSVSDCRKFRISIPIQVFGIAVVLCVRFFLSVGSFSDTFGNCAAAFISSLLLFFGIHILSDGELGIDRILFGVFTAFYCGFYGNVIAVFFSAALGILFYLFQAVVGAHGKDARVFRPIFAIPFVPFIAAGAVLEQILFSCF